jgi:branched-chain amino acid transport system substrate-binding protein
MRQQLGASRVAVTSDDSESGRRLAALISGALEAEGAELILRDELERGAETARPLAERLAAAAPEAIFFGGEYPEAAALRRELGRAFAFVSDDGVLTPKFVEAAGREAAEGAYVIYPGAEPSEALLDGFRSEFGVDPGAFASEAFAATRLLGQGIESAGTNRDAVSAFLRSFSGEVGGRRIEFTTAGENAVQTFFVYEVVEGTWRQRRELTTTGEEPILN